MNMQKNEVNEMPNLGSEIIETARNLESLITMYVLIKNSPLEPYYSDLCRRLQKLEKIIERDSQHPETAANVANAVTDGSEKDGYPMVLSEDVNA